MGIDELRRRFQLHILDCSSWLMPQTKSCEISVPICDEAINIGSLSEFRRPISSIPTGFAIDYIGQFSVSAILMFHLLKRNGFKLIVIDSGAFPLPIQWRQ